MSEGRSGSHRDRSEDQKVIRVTVVVAPGEVEEHWIWPGTPLDSILLPGQADDLRRGLLEAYDEEGHPHGYGAPLEHEGARITLRPGRLERILPPQEREIFTMLGQAECQRVVWEAIADLGYENDSYQAGSWDELAERAAIPPADAVEPVPWFLLTTLEEWEARPEGAGEGAGIIGLLTQPGGDPRQAEGYGGEGRPALFHIASPAQSLIEPPRYRAHLLLALASGATCDEELSRALRVLASGCFSFELVAERLRQRHRWTYSFVALQGAVYAYLRNRRKQRQVMGCLRAAGRPRGLYRPGFLSEAHVVKRFVENPGALLAATGGGW